MAAVALALVVLGHEGQRLAVPVGDLLRAVLVDRVVVAGLEGPGIAERDLLLAEIALALDPLAVHAGAIHAVADVAQQRLHAGRGEDRVVDVVVARRGQARVALGPRLAIGVVEDDELELSAHEGHEAVLGQAGDLGLQDLARALWHRGPVEHAEVRHDERGRGQPRDDAKRVEVRGSSPCRRSPSPTRTSGIRRPCSSRRRRRAGSCSTRRRARRDPRGTAAPRRVCRRACPAYR